jgi:hypothetical protein
MALRRAGFVESLGPIPVRCLGLLPAAVTLAQSARHVAVMLGSLYEVGHHGAREGALFGPDPGLDNGGRFLETN